MLALINQGGHTGEAATGEDVHDQTDGAGGADGDHLHGGDHNAHQSGGQGAKDEAGDGDDGVLYVQGQEAGHGGDEEVADEDDCVGDSGQHTQQGDFLGVGDVCTHD